MSAFEIPTAAVEWLRSGERGLSSEAIFETMTGLCIAGRGSLREPSDPSDLRRCRLLLEAVPEWNSRLPEMANASESWARLIGKWDEICALVDEEAPEWRDGIGSAPKAWAMMSQAMYGEKPRPVRMERR